ncbi:MAG: 3'(2'),5'-bisphosphate nucleotidase CysQ [Bacteroidia bacterium]|nr:3'(2'),5'-bisphosphate nucleotidase CysQ [Bacteroidia bacterium]
MLTVTQTLLDTLVQIARTAGEKILEVYADESSFQVETKDNNSPLTRADRAAHEIIAARLAEITPEIPVLSEEGKDIPYETRATWERFWLVDPLDGTKEFIKRNGEFTVNIALIEGGLVVMGCVHVPVMGLTYYAAAGQGTWKIEGDAAPVQVMASEFSMQDSGLRIVCSRSHMTPEVEAYLAQFEEPVAVSLGSSLKLVMVAEGAADIYPRLGPTMEWDTAAAQILVEEAGGTVINHETGGPLTYNKENLLNPYFIVFARKKG